MWVIWEDGVTGRALEHYFWSPGYLPPFILLSVSKKIFHFSFLTKCAENGALWMLYGTQNGPFCHKDPLILTSLCEKTASCLNISLKTNLNSTFSMDLLKLKMQLMHIWQTTHTHWPDNREKNGSAADEVDQKEDLLPQVVFARAFLCGLDDDVGDISQDLEDDG